MIGLVDIVQQLTDWLNENVCPSILLLEPDDDFQDESYSKAKRVHPKAYPLFTSWANRSASVNIPGAPCIVVGVLNGTDVLKDSTRTLNMQLQLISWNPGQYGTDTLKPIKDEKAPFGVRYVTDVDQQTYERSQDGWKDSYNFMDIVLRELEKQEFVSGTRIKLKDGSIEFGHYRDDTGPIDLYPYWINYIRFQIECGNNPLPREYADFL